MTTAGVQQWRNYSNVGVQLWRYYTVGDQECGVTTVGIKLGVTTASVQQWRNHSWHQARRNYSWRPAIP